MSKIALCLQEKDTAVFQDEKKQYQITTQERDELRKKLANTEELQGIVSNLYFSLVAETQGDDQSEQSQVQYDLQQVRTALETKWLKQGRAMKEDVPGGENCLETEYNILRTTNLQCISGSLH